MAKIIKIWNGRAQGKHSGKGSYYVAAYSQKQAAELIMKAGETFGSGLGEIRNYYSPCWGNSMDGITPTEPCVYYQDRGSFSDKKPIRIL